MKSIFKLPLLIACLSLASCGNSSIITSSSSSSSSSSTSSSTTSSSITSSSLTSTSVVTSSSSSSSSSSTSTSSSSSSYSTSSYKDAWFEGRTLLDCGFYTMDLPKNHNNPITLETNYDSTSWNENYCLDELPNNFRYIYANSCDDGPSYHKCSPNFYSYNASNEKKYPGGLKFTRAGIGLQSYMFSHTGEKLEIRIGISQVNNATGKVEEGKEPLHIYLFDKNGTLLGKEIIPIKTIDTSKAGSYVKVYSQQSYTREIAYIDVRMNAQAYKGQQNYNIGISYLNFKSWPNA